MECGGLWEVVLEGGCGRFEWRVDILWSRRIYYSGIEFLHCKG
jgi:hypothetical protein